MKRVYFYLHRGRSLIAWLIRYQSRTNYSHVAVGMDGIIYEARELVGVRTYPGEISKHVGEEVDVYYITVDEGKFEKMREFYAGQVGKPYDYLMVLRFITRRQESRRTTGKWFCSEYAFAGAWVNSVVLLKNIEPWAVSPAMFSLSTRLVYEKTVNALAPYRFKRGLRVIWEKKIK